MSLPVFFTLDETISYWAAHTPNNEAAVQGGMRLTYVQLERKIADCAGMLKQHSVEQGNRIGVMASSSMAYLILLMAISRVGAIYVGINPKYVPNEIAHALSITEPVLIFVELSEAEPHRLPNLQKASAIARTNAPIVALIELSRLSTQAHPLKQSPAKPQDIAVIVFTSGSTGKPKGAALHHSGLLASAVEQSKNVDGEPRKYLCNLPINHVGAIMNLTLGCLVAGGTLVLQPKFDPAQVLQLIEQEKISSWLQVPTMFTMVTRHSNFEKTNLSNLKSIVIGGGAVSAPTLAALHLTGADIFVEYGQTEVMSTLAYSRRGDSDEVLLNTVGKFAHSFDVRIADENGKICDEKQIGEIQVRGDCVLKEYWRDVEQTQAVFTPDGWLKTGDLATFRKDGNVVLKGRAREMIKTGGYNVYPREVEAVLERHPFVSEIVIFGTSDELFGEIVNAAVEQRKDQPTPSDQELIDFCRKSLAGYKIPKKFVFISPLPRLGNGKLDRVAIAKFQTE